MEIEDLDNSLKLRGFYKAQRSLVLTMTECKLTADQFMLFHIYLSFADWDDRHRGFAICKISNTMLTKIIGLNYRKVNINKKILFAKGYINLIPGKNRQEYVKILDPYKYYKSRKKKKSG